MHLSTVHANISQGQEHSKYTQISKIEPSSFHKCCLDLSESAPSLTFGRNFIACLGRKQHYHQTLGNEVELPNQRPFVQSPSSSSIDWQSSSITNVFFPAGFCQLCPQQQEPAALQLFGVTRGRTCHRIHHFLPAAPPWPILSLAPALQPQIVISWSFQVHKLSSRKV